MCRFWLLRHLPEDCRVLRRSTLTGGVSSSIRPPISPQTMAQIPQDVNPLGVRAALADIVKTNTYVTDIDEFLRRRLEGAWTT
jgi:hypothetical protein